jgi:hypothetical protein
MARGDAADDDDDPMDDDDDRAQRHPFRDEEERDDVVALAVSRRTDANAMGRRIIRKALRLTCGGDGAAFDGARDVFRAGQCSGGYHRRMRQRQNLHQTYRQPKRNLPGSDILFAREIPKDDKDGLRHWKKEYDDDSNFHELEWVPFWACDTIEYMLNHAMRGYYPDTFMIGIEKFTVSGRKVPEYETDSMYVLIYLQKNIRNLGCLVDAALWYRQNYANSRPIREDTLQINKCGNFEKTPLEYLAQIYDWCMEETDVNTVQNLFVNLALSGEVEDLLRIGDIYNDTWIASRKPTCASPSLRYRRAVIDLAPVFASRGFKC